MRPSHRIALLALVVIAVLIAAALKRDDAGQSALIAEEDAATESLDRGELPPSSPPGMTTKQPLREQVAQPILEQTGAHEASSEPPSPTPTWTLRLHVQGPAHKDPVQVKVRARPDGAPFAGPETVTVSCELNKWVSIELADLLVESREIQLETAGETSQMDETIVPLLKESGT